MPGVFEDFVPTKSRRKKKGNVFDDFTFPRSYPGRYDADLEDEVINQTLDLSEEHGVPANEMMRFVAGPQPSLFGQQVERVKSFLRDKAGMFVPPIYGEQYREEQPLKTLVGMAGETSAAYIGALTATASDVLTNKVTGDKRLADLINRATGFVPTDKERQASEVAEYIGTLMHMGRWSSAYTGTIFGEGGHFVAPALKTILDAGLTFSSAEAVIQFSRHLTDGTPIDWRQVHYAGGIGVLWGTGEVAVAATLTGIAKGMEKYWGQKGIDLAAKLRPPGTTLKDQIARQEAEIRADVARAKEVFRKTGKMPEDLMEKYVRGKPPEGSAFVVKKPVTTEAGPISKQAQKVVRDLAGLEELSVEKIRELQQAAQMAIGKKPAPSVAPEAEIGPSEAQKLEARRRAVGLPKTATPAEIFAAEIVQAHPKEHPLAAEPEAAKGIEPQPVEIPEETIQGITGPSERAGFASVPQLKAVSEAGKKIFDTIVTFGEVRRTNPPLYDKLMKTFGKRSAAMETAINKLDKVMPKTLSLEDDVLLATTYETKGQKPPEHLKELYENFARILNENEKAVLEEGILSKTFQERMIEENLAKIESLREQLKHPEKSKRIQRLLDENEQLRNMRYLPHTQVARSVIESKINRLPNDKRKAFLDRLSYVYKKRSGKLTLKDYLDLGVIEKDDVRISRLTAQALADYQRRSAMKSLHDYAVEQELVQPASDELRNEGWLKPSEIGITAPELKGKLLHPLYAQSLREMVGMRGGRGGLRREIFAMVKIGQFIKPTIIYTYNAVQKMFRGMYSLNPKTEASALRQAFHHVLNKTPLYDTLNQDNLYQFPYEVSRSAQEEQLQKWMNQHNPDIDRAIKYAEAITDTVWLDPNKTKKQFIRDVFMAVHRAIAQLTWTGDKVQRTQSYLINRQMGLSHDEAVKLAAQSHGAYSELSRRYKDWASKYFFVYSFRLLMPVEMAKVITEPVKDIAYENLRKTGTVPSDAKVNQWAKAVAGSILIPVLVDSYMRWRGFEPEKHLGPVAWKYKKTVVVDGKEHEIIVGLNYILNQPIKYWQRLIAYDPINPETRWMQSGKNVLKWEIHPLYRIFFWDISKNKRSFGAGQTVYNTEANPLVQFGQIIGYTMGQSFRFIGGFMDAMGEGEMSDLERERQEKILDEGLSQFDQILFKTLGYNYIRLPLEDRKRIATSKLRDEIFKRGISYHRKYKDEKLNQKMAELKAWAMKMQAWIQNDMR